MFQGFGDLGLDLDKTGRIKLFSGTFIRASPLFLADSLVQPRAARQTAGLELVRLQGFVPLAGHSRGGCGNNVAVISCYSNFAEAIGNKFCRRYLWNCVAHNSPEVMHRLSAWLARVNRRGACALWYGVVQFALHVGLAAFFSRLSL